MKKIALFASGSLAAFVFSAGFAFADGSLPGGGPVPKEDESLSDEDLPEDRSLLGTETGDEFAPPLPVVEQLQADSYKMSHSQAYSIIKGAGIGLYSSGGCTNRYNSTCTSLEQINSNTIKTSDGQSGIVPFKKFSGCAVTITGGTEVGHASGTYSHWNGYKVDIRRSTCVDNYIRGSFTYIGVRGDGAPLYKSARGNIYANEGNHWDITYY